MRAGNGASSVCTSVGTRSISPPAVTREWPASTCSVKVEPERNMPQMKIGRTGAAGAPAVDRPCANVAIS